MRPAAGVTTWIGGIHSARLLTPGPVGVGSQVERVAAFLGRRVEYVLEVTDLTDEALAMRSVRSPFPMRVTYGHRDAGGRATRVSLRVQGDAGRFYALAGPLLGAATASQPLGQHRSHLPVRRQHLRGGQLQWR